MKETISKFLSWISDLSKKYRGAQIKASIKVNSSLIEFYFELGKEIANSPFKRDYGSKFYDKLSKELTLKTKNSKGFSSRNIRYIENFYNIYKEELMIFPQLVGQLTLIPWGHHRIIIDKCKDSKKALFFVRKTIEHNWSRSVLLNFLSTNLYEREGKAISNFSKVLPSEDGEMIQQMTKDPYIFDFVEITEDYTERELKDSLVNNVRKLLLELGDGFAFVGQEHRLLIGDSEFFLDLLFYNIPLHSYIVVEIKTGKFKPEHLGQLGLYVSIIDHDVKGKFDNQTIGLLICKDKDDVVVRYSLDKYQTPLGVSSYELSEILNEDFKSKLPSIEDLESELKDK